MAAPRSIEVKVGILILAAGGLLAAFILVMGGINFQPSYSIYVDFDNPGGLQTGAPVKIAGVKVGGVKEIEFRGGTLNANGKRDPLVRLQITIEKRYQKAVHENGIFYVTTQGVLGEQFLAIEPGSNDRPTLAENAIVRGLDPPRLDMLLAEGYELLHSTVASIRENRAEIGEAFDGMRKTLKGTGQFFDNNGGRLDRVMENVEQISVDGAATVKNVREKVEGPEVQRIITNVDHVTEVAARDAPPLLADARETMANARRVSATIGEEGQQKKIRQTIDDVSEIASHAKVASKDAELIAERIRQGKGTVGAVVMDEQLYDDLQELARDLKHNPWKFLWRE